jgi:putative transcriptional regulator
MTVAASVPSIGIHLDRLLDERAMTQTELAQRVGISVVNLSVLKNGRARAIRFTTLAAICAALDCQPGDLLSFDPQDGPADPPVGGPHPADRASGPGRGRPGAGAAA